MTVHNYTNTASRAVLDSPLNSSANSFTVTSFTGYPVAPFFILMDRDSSSAELMEVTSVAGSTLTVVRGSGGTASTSHSAGATVEHVIPAAVPQTVEQHVEATANIHGVTGSLIGADSTGTLANKTFTGAHIHNYSDVNPAAPNGGFVVNADSSLGRDGFVASNAGANTDRSGFVLRQSGSDRFNVFYDGTVKVTPSGVSGRPALEATGTIKSEDFEATDDITAAGDITAIGNVTAANVNAGNVNVSGNLSSTNQNTLGALTATGAIQANASGTGLVVANEAHVGSLLSTGNIALSGSNARLQFPSSPTAASPGTATGQTRYRVGIVETWDGSKWRAPYLSAATTRPTASGLITDGHTTIAIHNEPGSIEPFKIQVFAQAEFNSVPDGTRWDLRAYLDDATSGELIAVGVGNGFTQTGVGWTETLTGSHTIYFVAHRSLGAGSVTLTAFNQMFTSAMFGTVD